MQAASPSGEALRALGMVESVYNGGEVRDDPKADVGCRQVDCAKVFPANQTAVF